MNVAPMTPAMAIDSAPLVTSLEAPAVPDAPAAHDGLGGAIVGAIVGAIGGTGFGVNVAAAGNPPEQGMGVLLGGAGAIAGAISGAGAGLLLPF